MLGEEYCMGRVGGERVEFEGGLGEVLGFEVEGLGD